MYKKFGLILVIAVVFAGCAGIEAENQLSNSYSSESNSEVSVKATEKYSENSAVEVKHDRAQTEEATYNYLDSSVSDISTNLLLCKFTGDEFQEYRFTLEDESWNKKGQWKEQVYNIEDFDGLRFEGLQDGLFLGCLLSGTASWDGFAIDCSGSNSNFIFLPDAYTTGFARLLNNRLIDEPWIDLKRRLCNGDGTLADIQLKFNYGRELRREEVDEWDREFRTIGSEYFAETVTYDEQSRRYYMAFGKSAFFLGGGEDKGRIGIAVFDEYGKQIDRFMADDPNATIQQSSHGSIYSGRGSLFVIGQNQLLFIESIYYLQGTYQFWDPYLIDVNAHTFENLQDGQDMEKVQKIIDASDNEDLLKQTGAMNSRMTCPLIVEYAPDGTHVYKRDAAKTKIDTLGKEYKLAFYAVDDDGTCYLAFDNKKKI